MKTPIPDHLLGEHAQAFHRLLKAKESEIYIKNNKGKRYWDLLQELPVVQPSCMALTPDRIEIGAAADLSADEREGLNANLLHLRPWRKGPYRLFGINIDSEWHSDIKWNRLKDHIRPLTGQNILDIGASSGYYMFRMVPQNPRCVIGIEPYLTFYFQYRALQQYLNLGHCTCFPLRIEEMPAMPAWFDTVFCMGILYHRRSPLDLLLQIKDLMRPGGELILETLIIEGDSDLALVPENRYAKMNNIFFIPTVKCLQTWLARTGFHNIRCIDISRTTPVEQHGTPWVGTESLEDFLDPADSAKTVEGYPAPTRAILLADKK